MTRKTRKELAYGRYHVPNRGSYRRWIFADEGAEDVDLNERLMTTNRWLGDHLTMGPPAAVCRYVSEALRGDRPEAAECLDSSSINH